TRFKGLETYGTPCLARNRALGLVQLGFELVPPGLTLGEDFRHFGRGAVAPFLHFGSARCFHRANLHVGRRAVALQMTLLESPAAIVAFDNHIGIYTGDTQDRSI